MRKSSMSNFWESLKGLKSFYSFIGLAGIFAASALLSSEFLLADNLLTILRQASVLLILSTGLTSVVLIGGMDLSVGATAAFVGCTCAQFLKLGLPVGTVFFVGALLGAVVGVLNSVLIHYVRLPSFIATYGINWIMKGLSIIIMNGAIVFGLPEGFTWFGTGYFGYLPVIVIFALVLVVLVYVFLQKTTFGRDLYALGSNAEAALYSGMNVRNVTFAAFVLCGVTAGIGGLLMTARMNAAEAAMGDAYGLQTVAAVVIGGTSMLGGEGGMVGTVIGALILTIIVNIMNLLGISSFAQSMVVGVVIISMVLFDSYSRNRSMAVKR